MSNTFKVGDRVKVSKEIESFGWQSILKDRVGLVAGVDSEEIVIALDGEASQLYQITPPSYDTIEEVSATSASLVKGDVVKSRRERGERKVLAAVQGNYLLSQLDRFDRTAYWATQQGLFKQKFDWVTYDGEIKPEEADENGKDTSFEHTADLVRDYVQNYSLTDAQCMDIYYTFNDEQKEEVLQQMGESEDDIADKF